MVCVSTVLKAFDLWATYFGVVLRGGFVSIVITSSLLFQRTPINILWGID
jgi:hypothetical protein